MATCPNCHTSSRADPDALWVEKVLVAKPLGTFSLAGQSLKTVAFEEYRLVCRCGWSIAGVFEGETFVGHRSTQVFPQ